MTDPAIRRPEDDPHRIHLRLSAQRALLGVVGPSVKSVSVTYRGNTIVFVALVDADTSDAQREDLDAAAGEVIADYPSGWMLDVAIGDTVDVAPGLPELVYRRRDVPR